MLSVALSDHSISAAFATLSLTSSLVSPLQRYSIGRPSLIDLQPGDEIVSIPLGQASKAKVCDVRILVLGAVKLSEDLPHP